MLRVQMTSSALLDRLEVEADAFATLLSDIDLSLDVPACPGWSVRDLAVHVGGVHQWAAHAVRAGNPDAGVTQPGEHDDLAEWYDAQARDLVDLLRATDPDAPAWTFGARPRTAAFWCRRQAHEVAMHRHDADGARGETTVFDEEFARDGLDEAATVFYPRQVRLGRIPPLPAPLGLQVSGGPLVLLGDGQPAETVTGPAEPLLLLLWRRTTLADPRLAASPGAAALLDTVRLP